MELLCLALLLAQQARAEDYRFQGLGTKYKDDGFDGFEGFSDEVEGARNQARKRVGEAKKEADTQRSSARDLKDTGDQIGKDRNQLLPQMQQASQQDKSNGTGSSSMQSLLKKPYTPPKKYQKAIEALGLRNNGELYYKGPSVQKKLYNQAEELKVQAQQSQEKAANGLQAARQLQGFQRIAQTRQAGMRSVLQGRGAGNNFAARSNSGGLGLGGSGANGSYEGSSGTARIGSGISDNSEKGAESYGSGITTDGSGGVAMGSGGGGSGERGSRGLASTAFSGNIDMNTKGQTNSAREGSTSGTMGSGSEGKSDMKSSLEKNFAALDALFDQVAGKPSDSTTSSSATAAAGDSGGGAVNEPLETLKAVLKIEQSAPPEKVAKEVVEPAAPRAPTMLAVAGAPSSELANGYVLEEDSLFQRIRQSYNRAAQSGRIASP